MRIAYGCVATRGEDERAHVERKPPDLAGAPPGWPQEASWERDFGDLALGCIRLLNLDREVLQEQLQAFASIDDGRLVEQGSALACMWRLAAASTLVLMIAPIERPTSVVLTVILHADILSDAAFEMLEAEGA